MNSQFPVGRVTATPEALELIEGLKERHGPVAFFHAGGSYDGSEPTCLSRAELLPDPDDIRIGEIAGAAFYVDSVRYERWGRPEFLIDVAEGPASGIALEGLEEQHFVTRPPRSASRLRGRVDDRRLAHA